MELNTEFKLHNVEENDEYIEMDVIAISSSCIQRRYQGKICFPSEVLKEKAQDLIGKPVLLDHEWKIEKVVGVVVDAYYDERKKAIVARLKIPKEGQEKLISLIKLSPSPIRDVSIGAVVKSKEENGSLVVQDISFKEISLVFEGADKNAKRITASKIKLDTQDWWDDPELRKKAPKDYFLDPVRRRYPYRTWDGEISCERLRAAMSLAGLHGESRIYSRAKTLYENHCGGKK